MNTSVRTLEHVGEWKVELRADRMEELFGAVAGVIADAAGGARGEAGAWESIRVIAPDAAALLVDWANELIGRGEVAGCAYGEVRDVAITPRGGHPTAAAPAGALEHRLELTAEVRGRPVAVWRSPLKAATYHGALVEHRGDRWHAEMIFDV